MFISHFRPACSDIISGHDYAGSAMLNLASSSRVNFIIGSALLNLAAIIYANLSRERAAHPGLHLIIRFDA